MDKNEITTEYGKTYRLNGQEVDAAGNPIQKEHRNDSFSEFLKWMLIVACLCAIEFAGMLVAATIFLQTPKLKDQSLAPNAPIGSGYNLPSDGPGDFQPIDPRIESEDGSSKLDYLPPPPTTTPPAESESEIVNESLESTN
ncbi:hypothetical protein IJG73_03215 [Candidatus Saccharibacteria bacterium]|nr:hypothetical protein [Candidatus Saccharibacteria bacterium]